jgi:hypothetical protein
MMTSFTEAALAYISAHDACQWHGMAWPGLAAWVRHGSLVNQ